MLRKEYLYSQLESLMIEGVPAKVELVNNIQDADVLYLIDHTYTVSVSDGTSNTVECEHYKTGKVLNQFWWEGLLVTKQMLSKTINRAYGVYNSAVPSIDEPVEYFMNPNKLPSWFPESYDLSAALELWSFVRSYLDRL